MDITIEHPTDRANYTEVTIGGVVFYFSYKTCIAFWDKWSGDRPIVSTNEWSTTTGRHLNYIDAGEKSSRVSSDDFAVLLHAIIMREKV